MLTWITKHELNVNLSIYVIRISLFHCSKEGNPAITPFLGQLARGQAGIKLRRMKLGNIENGQGYVIRSGLCHPTIRSPPYSIAPQIR